MGRELAGGGLAMSGHVADNAAAGFVGWYRAAAAARLAILTAAGLFLLGVPLFAMHLVERALANGALDALIVTSLGVAIAVAIVIGLETAAARLAVRIGRHIDLRLGPRLLKAAVAARAAGRPAADPGADLGVIREFLAGPSLPVLVRAAWSGAYLILAVLLHPILGAVSILAAVVLVALASRAERSGPATPDDAGRAGVGATDARFAAESRFLEAIGMTASQAAASHAVSRGWHPARAVFAPVGATGVGPLLGALLVVGVSGSALVMVDELSLGVMVGLLVLVLMALAPVSMLPWAWARARQATGARRRLLDIVAMEPSRPAAAMARLVDGALGEGVLSVANLNHAGEGASLKGISLELRRGQTLMVSGGTGQQRALLADLLLGLRRPDSGAVRFAGRELSDQDRAALAPYMDFVPAAGGLLAGSIRQNISRFADAPLAAVREAAAAAEIDRIIETLPDGYGTKVGDGAVDVAPGFGWRIGLARAAFGGANYVIVEVPEATVEDADLEAMVGRLRAADKIVVLFAADPPVGGPWGLLQLQPDGTASSRASPPQALVAPPVPSGQVADRDPAITPAGPPADDPRLVVLERFLTRIRGNLTDVSRPSPMVAGPAQTSADPGAYRPVLHINPDWLARHVRAPATDDGASQPG